MTVGWRKLHEKELHSTCSSPHIITLIKSRRMRLTRRVARMGVKKDVHGIMLGKP